MRTKINLKSITLDEQQTTISFESEQPLTPKELSDLLLYVEILNKSDDYGSTIIDDREEVVKYGIQFNTIVNHNK